MKQENIDLKDEIHIDFRKTMQTTKNFNNKIKFI
jgi:hypothetical protein